MRLSFVILCLGRSGSTHLQSLLGSHPEIRCFGELFTDNANTFDEVFLASPHEHPRDYIAELTASLEATAVGFKLPMNSIRAHPSVLDVLDDDPDIRVIRLSRENKLAQFVSRRMLATTGVPQSTSGSYGDACVRLEPRTCRTALESIERHELELDELSRRHPTFHVTYEELIANEGLDGLQRFLGVEARPLQSAFTKLRTRPMSETVENWDELLASFRGTRFERFFVDGP